MQTLFHKLSIRKAIGAAVLLSSFGQTVNASVPSGYYNQVDLTSPQSLRTSLHNIIDDHQRFPYTSSSTDTWDILEQADQDPDNSNNVIDIYLNASYQKVGGGNSNYNREHSWPKSYGFPKDGSDNSAYTDTHHLFIANSNYNSSRSNKPYDNCTSGCDERVTQANNNRGGTSSESNLTTTGVWQTWSGRKGDVARALLYMDVRYEGGTHSVTGNAEPDLILTDDRNLITNSSQGTNLSVAYMGLKSVLIQWHKEDPVDDFERRHNDAVYSFQGNRNPFIDHPEYVACVFESNCNGSGGDTTPPNMPTGLGASSNSTTIDLAWTVNSESDIAGYNIYRSTTTGSGYVKVNASLVNTGIYEDKGLSESTTYFYVVTAVDTSGNESSYSTEVNATTDVTGTSPTGTVWINELHYDNNGSDSGEFVEVAGSAGTSLNGWSLVAYNGNGGASYATVNLSGSIPSQQSGLGTKSFSFSGLQNGSPDGIALVNASGELVQFLSYEGSFTATNGAASGTKSIDIGVSETSTTPVGHSLQLAGTGSQYSDFTWQSAKANTSGQINQGQSLNGGSGQNSDPIAAFTYSCSGLQCQFDASQSSDQDGTIVNYQWGLGDSKAGTGIDYNHSYSTTGSYTVRLTVTDNQGGITATTREVSVLEQLATPVGLSATGGSLTVGVNWTANSESHFAGYNLYRSTTSGSGFSKLNSQLLTSNSYQDNDVVEATTYYYRVSAVDTAGNETVLSLETSATTDSPIAQQVVWINEFHYDNSGSDRNEFIEVAGTSGTDLSGWQLIAYNGSNGQAYKTLTLSGSIANLQNNYGVASFAFQGLQNGKDGIALVNDSGELVQFISYEGTFVATNGVAQGQASVNINVSENSSTNAGYSLQLTGSGSQYGDFTWQSPANDTPGSVNNSQTLGL